MTDFTGWISRIIKGKPDTAPRTILLMRHAEKPRDPDDPNLSEEGRVRAERLARFIPEKYGKPDFVFAAAVSKSSTRSCLTMGPLCDTTAVPLDSSTRSKDCKNLAATLFSDDAYAGKLVVACWSHGEIPEFAAALKAREGDYPNPWDPSVFDMILEFDYGNGTPPVVTQVIEPF